MNENKINVIKNEKIYSIFFVEIAEILNEEIKINYNKNNFLVTLVYLNINYNMNIIKAYINIYPYSEKILVNKICSKYKVYRKLLSKRLRYRVKKIPRLNIFVLNK
ncbi:ribosome-binding factor A [Blattabacterium cuenoti]|uniref:ribosome-binding factor A n=1 Tax=Blattabacterium cuenoti TaxID=1653831 RepID=UPI00163C5CB8|nr:ribosome-binding factor A [Blattabacterium cuenoti]